MKENWVGLLLWWLLIIAPMMFGLVSAASKRSRRQKTWDNLLDQPGTDQRLVALLMTSNFAYSVSAILKPYEIDPEKFWTNLVFLEKTESGGGQTREQLGHATPSISSMIEPEHRPFWPIWMIAAFPDVAKWIMESESDATVALSFEGVPDQEYAAARDQGWDSAEMLAIYRKRIDNYIRHTGQQLEVH